MSSLLDRYTGGKAGQAAKQSGNLLDQYIGGNAQPSLTVSVAPQTPPAGSGQVASSPPLDPALLEDGISAEELAALDALRTTSIAAQAATEMPSGTPHTQEALEQGPFYDASLLEPVVTPQMSQGQPFAGLFTPEDETALEKADFADNLAALQEHGRVQSQVEKLKLIYQASGPRSYIEDANLNPSISGISGVPGNFKYLTVQGDVPVDDEYAIKKIAEGNLFQKNNNALSRGVGKVRSAFNMMALEFNLKNPDEFARKMGELHRIYPQAPPEIQAGLKQIIDAKTNKDAIIAVFSNPNAVISVVGESLVSSIPSIATFIGTTALAGPVAGAAAGGAVSGANEYALTLIAAIQEAGVNVENTAAVVELLGNKEFMDKAREKGAIRGMAIGTFDALSMGLAGKLTAMASAAGKSKPVVGAALTGDLLAQGVFGATGEYAAQKGEQYFGHRVDKDGNQIPVSRGEILLEGIAELIPGGVEILLTSKSANEKAQYNQLMKELNAAQTDAEAQQIQTMVLDLLSPSSSAYQDEGELSVNDALVVGELDGLAERAIALGGKGNAALANGIRLKIKTSEDGKGPEIDQKYLEFIRGQVAEREADPARIAALPDATGFDVLRKFALQPSKSKPTKKEKHHDQQIKFDEVIADGTYEPNLAAAAAKLNEIYNAIRDAGFDPNKSVALAPDEVKALRSQMSSITGTVSRLVNFQAAAIRGYKNAKDAETIDAITMDLARYIRGEGDNQGPSIVTSAPTPPNADAGVGNAGVDAAPIEDGPAKPLNPAGTTDAALFGDTPAVDTGTPDAPNQTGGSEPLDPNKPSEDAIDDDPAAPQEPRASTGALTEPNDDPTFIAGQDLLFDFDQSDLGPRKIHPDDRSDFRNARIAILREENSGGDAKKTLTRAEARIAELDEELKSAVAGQRELLKSERFRLLAPAFFAVQQEMLGNKKSVTISLNNLEKALAETATSESTPAEVTPPAEPTPDEVTPPAEVTPVEEVNPQAPTETPAGKPVAGKEVVSVQTPDGAAKYKVQGKVIELADLKAASGKLQPRDRNRKESDVLAKQRAGSEFNAARLLDDPTSGSGAPIIARDGTVMSGNGRVLTMQEVYGGNQPDSQAAYTQALSDAGIDTTGFSQPIYVRQLADDMTVDDLVKFASASNSKAQADMSMTERATEDAVSLNDSGIIDLYVGGEVGNSLNRKFITEFNNKIVSATEQGAFTSGGKLTREGVIRVQNAILASAFGNPDTLAGMLESTEVNIKAISNAFMSVAPKFAQLKKQINDGRSGKEWDITPQLADMANLISDLRSKNTTVKDYYNQDNMFEKTDPEVEALIKAFYNDDLTRANSQKKMEMFLNAYVDEALKKESGGFLADETTPSDVIETAKDKAEEQSSGKSKQQGGLFEAESNVQRNEAGGKQVQRPELAGGRKNTGSRRGSNQESNTENVSDNNRSESKASVETSAELRGTSETTSDPSAVEKDPKGAKPGTIMAKVSANQRQSRFLQAYRDAGLDPRVAVNKFSAKQQFTILQKIVKEKFGFTYIEKGGDDAQNAVNNLLDAYRNLQMMSHVLGIGNKGIGLDGSLGLAIPDRAWGGYLAAYYNKMGGDAVNTQSSVGRVPAPVIVMPGKSTSFAHEWGHALDYHILERVGDDWGRGITGRIKGNLAKGEFVYDNDAPTNLIEAMGDLMNAMFFNDAEIAAKIMEVEQKIAKAEAIMAKKGTTVEPKYLAPLRRSLEKLIEGGTQAKVGKSGYKADVLEFMDRNKQGDYWIRPTEMFARVMEMYVAHKVTGLGNTASTEFIASTKEAYELTMDKVVGGDDRLALTYVNQPDRDRIYLAMDRLFDVLREDMFTGPAAEKPGDNDMIDAHDDFYAGLSAPLTTAEKRGWFENEKRVWRVASQKIKELKARPSEYFAVNMTRGGVYGMTPPALEKWLKTGMIMLEDNVLAQYISTKRGHLFTLAARYKDNKAAKDMIEKIIERVASDPGSLDDRVTLEGGTFEEAVRREGRRFTSMFKRVIDKHEIDDINADQMQQLRLLLTSDKAAYDQLTSSVDDQRILSAAAELRTKLLNPIYDYMRQNNLDVNYVPDGGYMPRLMDSVKALDNLNAFKYGEGNNETDKGNGTRGAYHLYANVVYENELGVLEEGDMEQIAEMLKMARPLLAGNYIGENTDLAGAIEQLKAKVKEIQELQDAQEQSDDPDDFIDTIAELADGISQLHAEVYEDMKSPYGEAQSNRWFDRMQQATGMDLEAQSVTGSFTKKRKLPMEADAYMSEFYLDPVESLTSYIPSVVRKVEYNKRFGTHLVPTGFKQHKGAQTIPGMPPPSRSYLDYLLEIEGAQKAGMKGHELQEIRFIVEAVTGTQSSTGSSGKAVKTANVVHAYGTMTLLPRAVLSSLSEAMTVGIQTGDVKDGIRAMGYSFGEGIQMIQGAGKAQRAYSVQLANILGVIDDPNVGEMVANRLGGTVAEDPKLNARMSRFFVRTGLMGFTNAQRRSAMRIGFQFFSELAGEIQNPIDAKTKKRAEETLQDLGIPKEYQKSFSEWLVNAFEEKSDYGLIRRFTGTDHKMFKGDIGKLKIEEVINKSGEQTDFGAMLSTAMLRFVDLGIADPKIIDRPKYAEHPVGRIVYGIQSFIAAFTRGVHIHMLKRVAREYKNNGAVSATTIMVTQNLVPAVGLFAGHMLFSTLREALLNQDKWKEEEEKDNLVPYLTKLAASRSGVAGRFDPVVNAVSSIRYQADLTNILVGSTPSYYAKALMRMAGIGIDNSENTVSAEYQATRGAYDILVPGFAAYMATSSKLGPVLGAFAGTTAAVASSPTAKHWILRNIIHQMTGEYYQTGGDGRKSGSGNTGRGASYDR